MYGCQQILIHPNETPKSVLKFISLEANKLTNCGIYYGRQLRFKSQKIIGQFDLEKKYRSRKLDRVLHLQAAQQTLRSVAEGFSFNPQLPNKLIRGKLDKSDLCLSDLCS